MERTVYGEILRMKQFIDKIFRISENHTTIRTEILAGITTFLTMAYIIFVQPAVLSTDFAGRPTGLDYGAVLLATCVSSALATIFMGLYARYPIALAPGMGENFFFVSVIMTLSSPALGFVAPWRVALGIVFISGIIFLILSVLKIRQWIIESISSSLRNGIAVGIGLFIAYLGLQNSGLLVKNELAGTNWVILNPELLKGKTIAVYDFITFLSGLLVACALQVRRVRGALLIGILTSTVTALLLGRVQLQPGGIITNLVGLPHIAEPSAFRMDIISALTPVAIPFIIIFLFMDLFDTVGTMIGVCEQAGFMEGDKLPRAERVLLVDAAGTVAGACLGTSTVTSYIESAAGVSAGGRTGLTSVIVGILFLLALLFSPLISLVGKQPAVTACALVIVGVMMLANARKIQWDDYSEAIPAFFIILGIPLTYSISDGLALGFISYPLVKFLGGKGRDVSAFVYLLGVILVFYFVFVRARIYL
jgi:AGZA family xanthine/uracil permease-like MFS transporter